jgi:outer membrane receptor protein involved in Fe transport
MLLLCFSAAHAQLHIKTSVTDTSREPLLFSSLAVYNSHDSSLITSIFSDSLGIFEVTLNGKYDSVWCAVSSFGYESQVRQTVLYKGDNLWPPFVLNRGTTELDGVTISSSRPLMERKVDRMVYNVGNSVAATGSDTYEILKKAPGVQVNKGVVSIAGKSTVSIMINDKLMKVDADEMETLLRSIPAADVSRIEVITTPPAKYDAEGNSGIIHIVTKKKQQDGFNASVSAEYEQRTKGSLNGGGSFNYRKGSINIYGNTHINKYRFISRQQTYTVYPEQSQDQILHQDNRPLYTYSQAGIDYTISKKSLIGFLYTFGTLEGDRYEHYDTRVINLRTDKTDSVMRTVAEATDKGRRHVFNLNYEWSIDSSGKKLSVNADYFWRRGNKERAFITSGFQPDGLPTPTHGDHITKGDVVTNIKTMRMDLEWPSSLLNLSAGGKITFIHNNSDNLFSYLKDGSYMPDATKSNEFDYRENTQAAYLSASRKWGKWSVQAGLRAEYTQTKGVSATLQQENKNDYFKLFPTLYLQYQPNDAHSWNINYSRRIERPTFWIMNPFRVYSTATAYEEGNPFLQPSFSNNIELGYAYKSILILNFYVQKTDALTTRVSRIDTVNNSFNFGQANAGQSLQSGLNVTLSFHPFPWWESTTEVSGAYSSFRSTYYGTSVSYRRPSFNGETNNQFTLDRSESIIAEIGFSYSSSSLSDFDVQSPVYDLYGGVKWMLAGKKVIIALNAEDILKTSVWKMKNSFNGTYQNGYFDDRSIGLSLTWKFGNNKIQDKRKRKTDAEETKRAG